VSGPLSALPELNKNGERVEVESRLVEGKVNVIFFHAPWSKTSSRYMVELDEWQKSQDETVVWQVNVPSLKSPAAKQYGLTNVPAFLIYNDKGELHKKGQSAQNEVIDMMKE